MPQQYSQEVVCTDTCYYPADDECDDGGDDSLYHLCPFGTDCTDCSNRACIDCGTSPSSSHFILFDTSSLMLHGKPTSAGTWEITVNATDRGMRAGKDPPLSTTTTFLLHVQEKTLAG